MREQTTNKNTPITQELLWLSLRSHKTPIFVIRSRSVTRRGGYQPNTSNKQTKNTMHSREYNSMVKSNENETVVFQLDIIFVCIQKTYNAAPYISLCVRPRPASRYRGLVIVGMETNKHSKYAEQTIYICISNTFQTKVVINVFQISKGINGKLQLY